MSPKNEVPHLRTVCLQNISSKLIYSLSDDEGANYEDVSLYLTATTFEVLQDLLKIILNEVNLDANIRFSCLQLLLRKDVRKLDTGMFPQFYYRNILEVITSQGSGLQHLNLKGVWVRDFPDLLSRLVLSLRGLKTLLIPHMADDAVIEAILTLRELAVLDVSGEACFTANGIKRLQSKSLQVLDIGMFGKINICDDNNDGPDLLSDLLPNLPNLISIRTYSFSGKAILKYHQKHHENKTKLKYLHDTGTSQEVIECVLQLCPDIENLHLDSAESGVLYKLTELKKLCTLKLTKCEVDECLRYLNVSGHQIQVLRLNHNKKTALDLSQICLNAPNLRELECYYMNLTFTNLETYFMSLSSVEITYCDVSDNVIRYVMTNSPFLRKIVIGTVIRMTDGDIFRLCADCDFFNLEELWFSCAKSLTMTSIELLMGHCKNLKKIGQLSGWDVTFEEILYLREIIIYNNINLKLLCDNSFEI